MEPEQIIADYQQYLGITLPEDIQGSAFQLQEKTRGWLFGLDSDHIHLVPFYAAPAVHFDTKNKEKILELIDCRKQKEPMGLAVGLSDIKNEEWIVVIARLPPSEASFDVIDDCFVRLQRLLISALS